MQATTCCEHAPSSRGSVSARVCPQTENQAVTWWQPSDPATRCRYHSSRKDDGSQAVLAAALTLVQSRQGGPQVCSPFHYTLKLLQHDWTELAALVCVWTITQPACCRPAAFWGCVRRLWHCQLGKCSCCHQRVAGTQCGQVGAGATAGRQELSGAPRGSVSLQSQRLCREPCAVAVPAVCCGPFDKRYAACGSQPQAGASTCSLCCARPNCRSSCVQSRVCIGCVYVTGQHVRPAGCCKMRLYSWPALCLVSPIVKSVQKPPYTVNFFPLHSPAMRLHTDGFQCRQGSVCKPE